MAIAHLKKLTLKQIFMFDLAILFIDKYFLWLATAIGAYKLLHIIFYKGLQPRYILNYYFVVFSGVALDGTKSSNQRQRFRLIHNILTLLFYFFLASWVIIHSILNGSLYWVGRFWLPNAFSWAQQFVFFWDKFPHMQHLSKWEPLSIIVKAAK